MATDARSPRVIQESWKLSATEAQCYALIENGMNNREIVIALRATSDRIRELRERWQSDGGADLMITTEAKDALEKLVGPFKDVTDLVSLVTAKLADRS